MTFPQQVTRYECPIDGCEWTYNDPGPAPEETAARATTDEAVWGTVSAYFIALEAVVREHMLTHPLLDWAREVDRLQRLHRESERNATRLVAILLRRLRDRGGSGLITDADVTAADGETLVREDVPDGFVLSLR